MDMEGSRFSQFTRLANYTWQDRKPCQSQAKIQTIYTSCLQSRQLPQWMHAHALKDKQKRKELMSKHQHYT